MSLNPKDNHIIVNYHYIEDPSPDSKGIHPIAPNKFRAQLQWLRQHYSMVSVPEVYKAAQEGGKEKMAAITFDDGLFDQFENASLVLEELNIPATFFIITSVFEGIIPATHKIHILLSRLEIEDLIRHFKNFLHERDEKHALQYAIPTDHRLTDRRARFDDILTANFKETMNRIPKDLKEEFLSHMFRRHLMSEREMAEELFMSPREIAGLEEAGFSVGSHGHAHYHWDSLKEEEIKEDVTLSKQLLENFLTKSPTIFSYPQGSPARDSFHVLKEVGFEYAVTTQRHGVSQNDSPFLIPRYDATDVKIN